MPTIPEFSQSVSLDRSTGENGLLLSLVAKDDSGLDHARFIFNRIDDDENLLESIELDLSNWNSLVNGSTRYHRTFLGGLELDPDTKQGTYVLTSVAINDAANNSLGLHRDGGGWRESTRTSNYFWGADAPSTLGGVDPSSLSFTVIGEPQTNPDSPTIDKDPPEISNLSLSTNVIDRSTGENGLLLSLDAKDDSGFNRAIFRFAGIDDDGNLLESIDLDLSDWDSLVNGGSLNDGTFLGGLELDPYTKQGTYVLKSVIISDVANNSLELHRESSWDESSRTSSYFWDPDATAALGGVDPSSLSFTVTGEPQTNPDRPAIDTDPPEISNLSLSTNVIDRSTGENGLLLSLDAKDDSGLDFARFYFARIDDDGKRDNAHRAIIEVNKGNSLVNGGSLNDGTFLGGLELDPYTKQGTYVLTSIELYDLQWDNRLHLDERSTWDSSTNTWSYFWDPNATVALGGVDPRSLSFTVTGESQSSFDSAPPEILSIGLASTGKTDPPDPTVVSAGKKTSVQLQISDESGLKRPIDPDGSSNSSGYSDLIGDLTFISPDGTQSISSSIRHSDRIAGDEFSGSYQVALELNDSHQPGLWYLSDLYIQSNSDHWKFSRLDISRIGHWRSPMSDTERVHMAGRLGLEPSALSFEYDNPNYTPASQDKTPPQLTEFSIQNANNQQIVVSLHLNDREGGLRSPDGPDSSPNSGGYNSIGHLEFISPDGTQSISSGIHHSDHIAGDEFSSTYQVALELDDSHQPGLWSLTDLSISDYSDNWTSINRFGNWNTPMSDTERVHMAGRLGLEPSALSFEYDNPNYIQESLGQDPQSLEQYLTPYKQLTDVSISNVNNHQVVVTLQINDRNGGNEDFYAHISFLSPDGTQSIHHGVYHSDRIAGDEFSGTYQVILELNKSHQPGLWTLWALDLNDSDYEGNVRRFNRAYSNSDFPVSDTERAHMAGRLGLEPSALSFEYDNPNYDPKKHSYNFTPPEVTGISIVKTNLESDYAKPKPVTSKDTPDFNKPVNLLPTSDEMGITSETINSSANNTPPKAENRQTENNGRVASGPTSKTNSATLIARSDEEKPHSDNNKDVTISGHSNQLQKVKFTKKPNGNTVINTLKTAQELNYLISGNLESTGAKINGSVFTLAPSKGNDRAQLMVSNNKVNGLKIFTEQGTSEAIFEGKVVANLEFIGSKAKEIVRFSNKTILKDSVLDLGAKKDIIIFGGKIKRTEINLGGGADRMEVTGKVNKAVVNFGPDKKRDDLIIGSTKSIKKRIIINNFGRKDNLMIGDKDYNFSKLQELNGKVSRIKVNFQQALGGPLLDSNPEDFIFTNEVTSPIAGTNLP